MNHWTVACPPHPDPWDPFTSSFSSEPNLCQLVPCGASLALWGSHGLSAVGACNVRRVQAAAVWHVGWTSTLGSTHTYCRERDRVVLQANVETGSNSKSEFELASYALARLWRASFRRVSAIRDLCFAQLSRLEFDAGSWSRNVDDQWAEWKDILKLDWWWWWWWWWWESKLRWTPLSAVLHHHLYVAGSSVGRLGMQKFAVERWHPRILVTQHHSTAKIHRVIEARILCSKRR